MDRSFNVFIIDKASEFFILNLAGKAITRTQGSFHLDDFSEPEPDIALLSFREDYYKSVPVEAKDILLLVEVAVKSLDFDRTVKLQKYASAGIPEYWILIPEQGRAEVYRQPEGGVFREKANYGKADAWSFVPFNLSVRGTDLLI